MRDSNEVNRSQRIEKLICIGGEAELGEDKSIKSRLINANKKILNLDDALKKQDNEIKRLKAICITKDETIESIKKKKPERRIIMDVGRI